MNPSKRVLVNTIVQYGRTLINTCLSLYTVRVVLQVLGQDDYGIYSLVGGIIAMLGFVTNAMIVTTQRHLSYSYGKAEEIEAQVMFSNSVLLHFAISWVLVIAMILLKDSIFCNYLVIAPSRLETAKNVYLLTVAMLFVSFNTAPFKALFIARENIVFISCVEVFDCFLKLSFVLMLAKIHADKLLIYALMMLVVFLIQLLAFSLFALWRFEECKPRCFWADRKREYLHSLLNFAGWTTYGTATVVIRNQGLAVILNHFLGGTIINAAYGIAQQVYGSVSFLAGAILNAMNPQIMKAEGRNDRQKMLMLAQKESKLVLTILSIFLIPLIVEMPTVLHAWLGENGVSEYTPLLCRFLLLSLMIDQSTYGLHTAVQAIGEIRVYTLLAYTPKILLLGLMWLMFVWGYSIVGALFVYVLVEVLVAVFRVPYVRFMAGLNVVFFLRDTLGRIIPLIAILILFTMSIAQLTESEWRFLFSIPVSVVLGLVFAWVLVLDKIERDDLRNMLKSKDR